MGVERKPVNRDGLGDGSETNSVGNRSQEEKLPDETTLAQRVTLVLDAIRESTGDRQQDVARALGVNPSALSQAKSGGTVRLSRRTVEAFSRQYSVNAAYLESGTEPMFLGRADAGPPEIREPSDLGVAKLIHDLYGEIEQLRARLGERQGGPVAEDRELAAAWAALPAERQAEVRRTIVALAEGEEGRGGARRRQESR